jgi:predicted transcriptional regulator/nucleoside 2-deoxyribosyltransferase
MAAKADNRPGTTLSVQFADLFLLGSTGVIEATDLLWLVETLADQKLIEISNRISTGLRQFQLTYLGWQRIEELKKAHVASNFAFFARRFENSELDEVFEKCLRPAVTDTGYDLRTVTQRAGLIDAVVEDEIRRCKFVIADLSDDNAGAYWEAGFAHGLGKPVIYICRAKEKEKDEAKRTHFDTDHRQTVRWDLQSLEHTSLQLKAVIRNTLLGDANQDC